MSYAEQYNQRIYNNIPEHLRYIFFEKSNSKKNESYYTCDSSYLCNNISCNGGFYRSYDHNITSIHRL